MVFFNTTCNATLDDLRIGMSEVPIAGPFTFHQLGLIICGGTTIIALALSFFLMWMHALHYTRPYEQRHIIRILFMVPVYAVTSFLSFWFYYHAIYFSVMADCYEAFAIASFFSLLCHYVAPDLHDQKEYFRRIQPKPWVLPLNWFNKCCGGERGPWRTPRSGLTWFNIVWTGVYQYCAIIVVLTLTSVVTQYYGKYCESSDSPVFAHVWVLAIEFITVSIIMYCIIQFYIQLKDDLKQHNAFLKILAIKLVVFFSFWQSAAISLATSDTLSWIEPSQSIAYPDIKVGIPSLLLCIEMALFALMHQWAFPYSPYRKGGSKFPIDNEGSSGGANKGGVLGYKAIIDAMNPWDLVKAFARGMRWLFVGVRTRENDVSYKIGNNSDNLNDMTLQPTTSEAYKSKMKGDDDLPIANEFRKSNFGIMGKKTGSDENAALIANAQPTPGSPYIPASQRYDRNGQEIGTTYSSHAYHESVDSTSSAQTYDGYRQDSRIGMALSEPEEYSSHVVPAGYAVQSTAQQELNQRRAQRARNNEPKPSQQWANSSRPVDAGSPATTAHPLHNALWGAETQQSSQGEQRPPQPTYQQSPSRPDFEQQDPAHDRYQSSQQRDYEQGFGR